MQHHTELLLLSNAYQNKIFRPKPKFMPNISYHLIDIMSHVAPSIENQA